jgi:hypothetical protein
VPVIALLDLQLKADSLAAGIEVIHETLAGTRAFAGCLGVAVLVDSKDRRTWSSMRDGNRLTMTGPTGSGGPALAPRTSAPSWPPRPGSMYLRWLRPCKYVHHGHGD